MITTNILHQLKGESIFHMETTLQDTVPGLLAPCWSGRCNLTGTKHSAHEHGPRSEDSIFWSFYYPVFIFDWSCSWTIGSSKHVIFIWVVILPLLSWTACSGCLLSGGAPHPCTFCIRLSPSWWKASTSTMSRFASSNLSKVKVHEKKYKMSLTHEVSRVELRVAVFFSENHFKRAFQHTSKQAYYIQVK